MKVVITGGGGFLGNQLARKLVRRGSLCGISGKAETIDELVIFDKIMSQQTCDGLGEPVRFVEGDIANRDLIYSLIDRDDISVFHLASVVSAISISPWASTSTEGATCWKRFGRAPACRA